MASRSDDRDRSRTFARYFGLTGPPLRFRGPLRHPAGDESGADMSTEFSANC